MSPTVPVQRGIGGHDMDGLLHPSLEPTILPVQDADVFGREAVVVACHVDGHWGRITSMFCDPLLETSFGFADVDLLLAVIATDLVDHT